MLLPTGRSIWQTSFFCSGMAVVAAGCVAPACAFSGAFPAAVAEGPAHAEARARMDARATTVRAMCASRAKLELARQPTGGAPGKQQRPSPRVAAAGAAVRQPTVAHTSDRRQGPRLHSPSDHG